MKLRTLLICLLACLPLAMLEADNNDDIKKKLNSIKKNSLYIYGEATAATEEEAHALAEEILYGEINSWAAKKRKFQKSADFAVNNIKSLCNTLSLPRGNMIRSFIYVKKSDIIPVNNLEIISNTKAEVMEESKVERISSSSSSTTTSTAAVAATPMRVPSCIQELIRYTDYFQMVDKLKEMKAAGKVKSYARYAQLDNPEACYLVIYNKAGKVVAILTPGSERRNVATGKVDAVSNYSGHGALGVEVNE